MLPGRVPTGSLRRVAGCGDLRGDFGYHWEKTALILGYRYLDVEYEDGDFLYDVKQDGPILGLIWHF